MSEVPEKIMEQFTETITTFLTLTDDQINAIDKVSVTEMLKNLFKDSTTQTIKKIINSEGTKQAKLEELLEARRAFNDFFEEITTDATEKQKELIILVADMVDQMYVDVAMAIKEAEDAVIGIKLTHPNAKVPAYSHEADQGMDAYAIEDITIPPHTYGVKIPLGFSLETPKGWAVAIRPRSGMSMKTTIRQSNGVGTVDAEYTGPVCWLADNIGDEPYTIHAGDRICQLILERCYHASFKILENITETERGQGGFGSTGA